MSEEESNKINYIATQIDELRREVAQMRNEHESLLVKHEKRLDNLVESLTHTFLVLQGTKVNNSEFEEVRRLASQKGVSVAEMVKELEEKGTLPPSIKKYKEAYKKAEEVITS